MSNLIKTEVKELINKHQA